MSAVDFKKALDTVDREALWVALARCVAAFGWQRVYTLRRWASNIEMVRTGMRATWPPAEWSRPLGAPATRARVDGVNVIYVDVQ